MYYVTSGSSNVALGHEAGRRIANGSNTTDTNNSIFIGQNTSPLSNGETNQIVIGYEADGLGSNTVVIGNDSILKTVLKGNIGIGTTTPSYKIDVNGDGRVDGTFRCVTLVQTSQRDQKENINNIDKSKSKVIPFKEYTYKSSIDGSARKRYGVIAEDIENDYPELVHTGADGVKGINYIDLLVKRVAELEKELEDISLTPGATGPQGPSGSNGNDGNNHLSNVDSITFDEKANQLVLTINSTDFRFSPVK